MPVLLDAFEIRTRYRIVSLTGAGGKTSLMLALAQEAVAAGLTVVTTTTTKIFPPKPHQSPKLLLTHDGLTVSYLADQLKEKRHVTVGHAMLDSGKIEGIPAQLVRLCAEAADLVIIEADGAAHKPVKAPEPWEPVIVPFADLVVPVVGLDCLGKPATQEWVFRLERFLAVTGLGAGDEITPESLGVLSAHRKGGCKDVPPSAGVIPFLNKAELIRKQADLDRIASAVYSSSHGRIKQLIVGSLKPVISVRALGTEAVRS